jgi:WD40 repeat protein
MASYYYGSGLTWAGYLQADSFVRDVTGQIKKSGEATRHEISAQTREVVASNEQLSQEFGRGFDAVNGTLEMGFGRLENALGDVEASIESLHSDFNYNMGLVLDQLQIQNQLTFGILERLDAIHKTLEHPELTKAREFYNRGCDRLSKGLLDKALDAFLNAEEKNDTDFFIQFQIGKLYLYGMDEDDNVIDLPKAEKHLRDATRYGKAEIAVMPEFKRWAGEALLHASIACYAQANDQQVKGDSAEPKEFISKAFQLAQQACEIYPSLSESQYHLAKYAALLGDAETSVQSLENAVTSDVNYCFKAEFDRDFDSIRPQMFDLFKHMLMKMSKKTSFQLEKSTQRYMNDMVYLTDKAKKSKENIRNILSNADIKIKENTLFAISEALEILGQIEPIILSIYNDFVEKNYEGIISNSLTFSPDLKFIIIGGELWQVSDGKFISKLPAGRKYSSDGKLIVIWDGDETVRLLNLSDGKLIHTLPGRMMGGKLASFSPDGKIIAIYDRDNTINLWNLIDGELIHKLPGLDTGSFSPDSKLIATWDHNTVNIWKVSDGELILSVSAKHDAFFSPDGKLIATNDNTIKIWKVNGGELIHELPEKFGYSFSPDGKLIVASHGGYLGLWQVDDGKSIQKLNDKTFLQFCHNGNLIITSDDHHSLNLKTWGRQVIQKKYFNELEHFEKTFLKIINNKNSQSKADIKEKQQDFIQKQTQERMRNGLCNVCGADLSFFDKLRGRTTCSKHS